MARFMAILAVCGALVAAFFSWVAYAYACEEREPCAAVSAPAALKVFAVVGLGGAATFLLLAWLRSRSAWAAFALTAASYLVWLTLFVYVAEGHL